MAIPRRLCSCPIPSVAAGLMLCLTSATAFAAGLLTLKSENDKYLGGDDGQYSNGVEAIWAFVPDDSHWLRGLANRLPGWSEEGLDGVAYRLTHQMYTPDDIRVSSLIEDDRPYAGVLLGGVSLFDEIRHDGWRETRDFNLDLGVVGPASGAGMAQREFHKLTGSGKPEGWDRQLDNEPVLNLAYKQAWIGRTALDGYELEHALTTGFALGNLYTYAAAGLGVRFGKNLDRSFGIPTIAPAQGGRASFRPDQGFSWYAFAALEGRYMARNLLLDGNTFENSHSVDRKEWVGDALLGAALTWDRWQLSYTHSWRTEEFEEQDSYHTFGSISLSRWF